MSLAAEPPLDPPDPGLWEGDCADCNGTGEVLDYDEDGPGLWDCGACNGTGFVTAEGDECNGSDDGSE